jgi:hypothetical protein
MNEDKYRVYFEAGSGQDLSDPRPLEDPPFCLGILGDFSGRGTRPARTEGENWASRPLIRVTPENVLSFGGLFPSAEVQWASGNVVARVHPVSADGGLPSRWPLRAPGSVRGAPEGPVGNPGRRGGCGRASGKKPGKGEHLPIPARDGARPNTPGEKACWTRSCRRPARSSQVRIGPDGDLDGFIRRVVRPHAVRLRSGPHR